ncbi:hypothetical protein L0657_23540 [Dyadobacter sp. CY345]|uniref:hypothetical protein n=1 Tax=Dyadobacter sp. CY345 TaxID=2909335 RepID=UPI001F2FAD71|nr:hypothetical protein [Dyadobacter sp. CY345]MCF2446948.1 hypothetical protein [Dyadobacter sp. CY345]
MLKNLFRCHSSHLVAGFLALSFCPLKAQEIELGSIKKGSNKIRYIAVGGSISSGVQNGGINQEGQLAAFPNLLARSMGISSFSQPLFEGDYKKGSGQVHAYVKNGLLEISEATDNAFIKSESLPKITKEIDNISIPYLKVREITVNENEPGTFLPNFDKTSYQHLNRYSDANTEGKSSYAKTLKSKINQLDFFTWELGADDFVEYYTGGGYGKHISYLTNDREGIFPENELIQMLVERGGKGAIANVPDILSLPYFNFYSYKNIVKKVGAEIYVQRYQKNDVRMLDPRDRLLPTDNVTALFTSVSEIGRVPENPLFDEEVIGYEEIEQVNTYNQWVDGFAKQNGLALVDLNSLYQKILKGDYVTEDGVKIDPSYPTGNFFSADGIHPSAVGQGVIANEFIRTINLYYGSKIALINISTIK